MAETRTREEILMKLADHLASAVADGNFDAYPFLRRSIIDDLMEIGIDLSSKGWVTTHWTRDTDDEMDPVRSPDPPGVIGMFRLWDDGERGR